MRAPNAWHDRGLLEDEPFLSAFKARKAAGPAARGGADTEDGRNIVVANEFKKRGLVSLSIPSIVTINFIDNRYTRWCKSGLILPSKAMGKNPT
jgi:hypothetical protein